MSLTGTHHIFGGLGETGINHFLDVFFTARPHLLAYGTAAFATNQNLVTLIDTSSLPSFFLGLGCLIRFTVPTIDVTPPDSSTELLPPGANQFTAFTEVVIDFLCGPATDDPRKGAGHPIFVKFEVAVLCAPVVVNSTPGTGSIGISVVQVKLAGIKDNSIEQILECILTRLLKWAFGQVTIPFNVFTIDGISLTLEQGPVAQDDQIEVFGDIT
jgi:hypothetical protein